MASATKTSKKAKSNGWIQRVFYARFLSSDFFIRNWKSVLLLMVMLLVYITNRYQCLTRMEEIRRLKQELEVVQTEHIRERSRYMSRIRESAMQEMVDTMHLNLRVQERPPYKIKK